MKTASEDAVGLDRGRDCWRKTARGRLRFELGGLAFAVQCGASPEDYARHLWGKGAAAWMHKSAPGAGEYLQKEAEAFRCFYPDVVFEVVRADDKEAELVFTTGCLGGWGRDPWAVASSFGLGREDVCRYCHEAFRVWADQLGLLTDIGLREGQSRCSLRVRRQPDA